MGHYHIFFLSKANAPYFPKVGGGMGVSIDRCLNKGMAAMLVSSTNALGIELYSHANAFFCFG